MKHKKKTTWTHRYKEQIGGWQRERDGGEWVEGGQKLQTSFYKTGASLVASGSTWPFVLLALIQIKVAIAVFQFFQ